MGMVKNLAFGVIRDDLEEYVGEIREAHSAEMAALVRQIEDITHVSLSGTSNHRELTKAERNAIIKRAYVAWVKNPLAGQAVSLTNFYVWGRGFTYEAKDEGVQEVLDDFCADKDNKLELMSHQARQEKGTDLQISGNVFFVLFSGPDGTVKLRSIRTEEIDEIITDPEDSRKVLMYKRCYSVSKFDASTGYGSSPEQKIAYYLDWGVTASDVKTALSLPEEFKFAEGVIYHRKVNSSSFDKFGYSELYRALDWLSAHKRMLEDWATIIHSLSVFSWKRKVSSLKKSSKVDLGDLFGAGKPPTGSILTEQQGGAQWEPLEVAKGATTSSGDSRQLKLMVAAATGIFEHYFGDPSTGNLATATSMELPMLKKFEDRQQFWEEAICDIFQYVIDKKIESGALKQNVARRVTVTFPNIIQKDTPAMIKSIVEALTLNSPGNTSGLIDPRSAAKLVLSMLGYDADIVKEMIEDMFPEADYIAPTANPEAQPLQNNLVQPTMLKSAGKIAAVQKEIKSTK